jgi:hypothetical protein
MSTVERSRPSRPRRSRFRPSARYFDLSAQVLPMGLDRSYCLFRRHWLCAAWPSVLRNLSSLLCKLFPFLLLFRLISRSCSNRFWRTTRRDVCYGKRTQNHWDFRLMC